MNFDPDLKTPYVEFSLSFSTGRYIKYKDAASDLGAITNLSLWMPA